MQWFVVKVRTAFEKKVKAQLEEQIELKELKDQFGRILVPIEEMVVARGEKKKRYKIESRIFPGYVFVEMSMDERAWHLVRSVPNVHGFVGGTKDKPSQIPIPLVVRNAYPHTLPFPFLFPLLSQLTLRVSSHHIKNAVNDRILNRHRTRI